MRYLLLFGTVLWASLSFSQTATKKPVKKPSTCEASANSAWTAYDALLQRNKELETQNAEATAKYAHAIAVLRIIEAESSGRTATDDETKALAAVPAGEVLNLGISLEKRLDTLFKDVNAMVKHDSDVVEKYNALLGDYKQYVHDVSNRMSTADAAYESQRRMNNAMAIYSLMPKYNPPQTINLNITNCTALPALCAH